MYPSFVNFPFIVAQNRSILRHQNVGIYSNVYKPPCQSVWHKINSLI
jgi:hypothetical protein